MNQHLIKHQKSDTIKLLKEINMKLSVILPSNKSNTAILRSLDSLVDRGLDDVEYLINLDNV